MATKAKKVELLAPDGKPFRRSSAWVRPERLKIHIISEPKYGKSSFVAALGTVGVDGIDPFIIPTQPGLEGIDVNCPIIDCHYCKGNSKGCEECEKAPGPGRIRYIPSGYDDIKYWVDWAVESPFNPIAIDPIAPALDACIDLVLIEAGVNNMNDIPAGAGWFRVKQLFQQLIGPILASGKGFIAISHLQWRDIYIQGGTRTVAESSMGRSKAAFYLEQAVDIEMQFDIEDDRWIARIKPGQANVGGDRFGYLPDILDRGKSPEETAKNFLSYFYEL